MQFNHGIHLAYCTNIHRGNSWEETFQSLKDYTLSVKQAVSPESPFAIGLRLSDTASQELMEKPVMDVFKSWLAEHNCYVFTINGFPFGSFHGVKVKEAVYSPDWTDAKRVAYTKRLFEILAELIPDGVEGSVSTVPCSFKSFITEASQVTAMQDNLYHMVDFMDKLSQRTGKQFHLGLEPEPLGYLETSRETVDFFEQMQQRFPGDDRILRYLGVNYDTCHIALQYESAVTAIHNLKTAGIRISKIHLSSALKAKANVETQSALEAYADNVYLHQVIQQDPASNIVRYQDLPEVLALDLADVPEDSQWRIHFHIPLHSEPAAPFASTIVHLTDLLDIVAKEPELCQHFEMETYTWEVLPEALRSDNVVEQLSKEYVWTIEQLKERGMLAVSV